MLCFPVLRKTRLTDFEWHVATTANRTLARVWNIIFSALDGDNDIAQLVNHRVIWMPSHRAVAAIGYVFKSNGKFITAIDWRANRLVDVLARLGAQQHCAPDLAISTFNRALAAAEFLAALAGTVTHRANHHVIDVLHKSGEQGHSVVRDSCPGVRPFKNVKRMRAVEGNDKPCTATCQVSEVHPGTCSSLVPRMRSVQALRAAKDKKARKEAEFRNEDLFQASWRENRAKRPAPIPPPMTAKERIEVLRRRIL